MLLELAQFVSFLLLLVVLCALFHHAFIIPSTELTQRILDSLRLLLYAAGLSILSGYLSRTPEQRSGTTKSTLRLTSTFPVQVFLWTAGGMALLFVLAWFLETYLLPWAHAR